MNLYVIRHTKVDIDTSICYGQTDVGLAPSFPEELSNVKQTIRDISFDKVYSSPLFRCKTLAKNIVKKENIIFDDRLKELNFGDFEGQTWDAMYHSPKGKEWMDNYQKLTPPNGEAYYDMVSRVTDILSEISSLKNTNVAIFTHAGVVRIIKHLIEDQSMDELFATFKPEYGSVTKFTI